MAKVVETFTKISAPDLLNTAYSLYGWIKKENDSTGLLSVVKVFDGWPWYFMIMRTGCLYLFKKAESANFSEAIPLTKYRVCDATDVTKYPWVFKLIHSAEVKTLFFSVDTELDLKNWKDAIIKEKEEYCSDGHNYCCIDEQSSDLPVFEEPPPPVRPSQRLPERSATRPLPLVPQHTRRPHSLSLPPEPLSQYDNAPPPPLKQHSPHSPSSPTKKKPATLPRDRPLPAPPEKSRREPEPLPSKKENLRRTSSESCLGAKPTTALFNSVVKQLENTRLSQIHEGAPQPMKPPPRSGAGWTPSKPNTRARCPPDGCESARGKHSEQVSPTWDQSPQDAFQNNMSKDSASRTLKLEQLGTYLTRPGNSESGKSLSMRDKNEDGMALIRHYRIFYNQVHGYALDNKGPWFDSISQVLKHYYQNQLPNTKGKLCYPYQIR